MILSSFSNGPVDKFSTDVLSIPLALLRDNSIRNQGNKSDTMF